MGEQIQRMPTNEQETAVIKKYFHENDALLQSMRAVMFNLEPSEADIKLVTDVFVGNNELYNVVYRRFLPTLAKDSPIGQVSDVWLGAEQMIFAQSEANIMQAIEYKELSINMTKIALESLRSGKTTIDISFNARKYANDPLGINLLARNQFIRHVESQLLTLKIVAGQAKEDKDLKKKNSSK